MKLEIIHYDVKYTIETQHDDVPTEVIVDYIYNLLVQVGYQPLNIAQEFSEKSEEVISSNEVIAQLKEELSFERRANHIYND